MLYIFNRNILCMVKTDVRRMHVLIEIYSWRLYLFIFGLRRKTQGTREAFQAGYTEIRWNFLKAKALTFIFTAS